MEHFKAIPATFQLQPLNPPVFEVLEFGCVTLFFTPDQSAAR